MRSGFWFKLLLAAGAVLAVALLAQTMINYRYVSENLVRQQARRVADDRVRGVERSARQARAQDAAAYQAVLDDFHDDVADQVAGVALGPIDGAPVASSGQAVSLTGDERQRFLADRDSPLSTETRDGRDVFVGLFPSRLRLPADEGPGGRLVITIAIYRDSLSAPFARLRRNAIISVSAALTLLFALALIALRFGAYVRGKQLEGEMAIARDVQRELLAPVTAWPPGVDGAAVCVPASSVGGDLYDVQALAGGRLALSIGDVSGHGLPAALLMSLLHGAMSRSGPPTAVDESLDVTAARLNDLLRTRSTGERFASVISCVYDPAAGELRYVNAGHPPGLLLRHDRDGGERVSRLSEGGPVLGVLPDVVYRAASIGVREGDLLVLYSDGIVETTSRSGEYYGEGRLLEVVERHAVEPATAICEAVLASVGAFAGGRVAADDRTLLIIRLSLNV